MILSPDQERAYAAIKRWSSSSTPVFLLAGYAGTGKTTLLQKFINERTSETLCLAPTGKAASVLQKKLTNARVSTVHRALYTPVMSSANELMHLEGELLNHPGSPALLEAIRIEKERLASENLKFKNKRLEDRIIFPGHTVVVDEASMVTRRMQQDLLSTGAKILYVGDPGQLPPVADEGFFQHHAPDALLEQVHRQALDSPIIKLSMQVRQGQPVSFFTVPGASKLDKESVPYTAWLSYDQVLTGTNESRRKINRYFRGQLNRKGWWPEEGDKLICLRNENEDGAYYINGVQGSALNKFLFNSQFQELQGDLLYEERVEKAQPFYRYPFQAHYDKSAIEEPYFSRQGLREFDYAYAITVHKSQGSEWGRVIIADDQMKVNDKEFRKRWLYTAITRAKEEILWLV